MTRFEKPAFPLQGPQKRGRGTGKTTKNHFLMNKYSEEEEVIKEGETEKANPSRPPSPFQLDDGIEDYLAANPAMTVRDFKGKGFTVYAPFDKHYVGPDEKPWHTLDPERVREAATSEKARFLSKAQRQAAARDPALIWDDRTREYRRASQDHPHPAEPKDEGL